jgi:mannosyltransferase
VQIVHCNEHNVYPFALMLRRFLPRPIVCHVRYKLDPGFAEWVFAGNRMPDALLWTSYQQKADSADAVEGVIPQSRQHVLRLGIDLNRFGVATTTGAEARAKWDVRRDETLVGTASPLRPRKKVEDFVHLIVELARRYENVVGRIAGGTVPGDEEYRAGIEQQIATSGLGRRLRWLGYLEPVEPFYHACDIVVSTSEYETFGNSVCEAMACCKPVAAYRGGSVAEVVGDSGLIVETNDREGLTAAVERLVRDPELRKSLGTKGRERVETEFNPRNSFKQLMGIYESLLTGHKETARSAVPTRQPSSAAN